MEELNNKYLQGLAKQIQTLIGEALPLLIEGSDCANHPLELACELCAEACPYCIDKGDLASAYIIIKSINDMWATMGRLNLIKKQEDCVIKKTLKLKFFSQDLERWINKGGCPQSLIRKAKETGAKMDDDGNWIYPEANEQETEAGACTPVAEAKEVATKPTIDDVIDKSWPQVFNTDDGKKLLQDLIDIGYCVPDGNRLKWVSGISLWGVAMYHLSDKMGIDTEDGHTPWKMLREHIIPHKGNLKTAINLVSKLYGSSYPDKPQNNPKGFKRLRDVWGLKE